MIQQYTGEHAKAVRTQAYRNGKQSDNALSPVSKSFDVT